MNNCNGQHNYLLHQDQGKATVNTFTVLEDEDADEDAAEEKPASEDEEDDSPRVRLLRGILQAGRFPGETQESEEDSSEGQGEAMKEVEMTSEDEEKLEPEKEKNPQSQDEEEKMEYCSMEAIAERWKDKPKQKETASALPEAMEDAGVKPVSSDSGTKGRMKPTLLLAELLQIEGNMEVMQYDTVPQPPWCPPTLCAS